MALSKTCKHLFMSDSSEIPNASKRSNQRASRRLRLESVKKPTLRTLVVREDLELPSVKVSRVAIQKVEGSKQLAVIGYVALPRWRKEF